MRRSSYYISGIRATVRPAKPVNYAQERLNGNEVNGQNGFRDARVICRPRQRGCGWLPEQGQSCREDDRTSLSPRYVKMKTGRLPASGAVDMPPRPKKGDVWPLPYPVISSLRQDFHDIDPTLPFRAPATMNDRPSPVETCSLKHEKNRQKRRAFICGRRKIVWCVSLLCLCSIYFSPLFSPENGF